MKESKDKSLAVAYFLLIFCGFLGIHRFYLGKNISGILFIILSYSYLPFSPAIVFVGIWLIIDIFLLPTLVKSANSLKHNTI
ncbi:TM2 domain-containing protein [Acinetobacter indicus]|uniref:TM2 domain-containing protein n=1 Tax=Acinetobacter indicus TaxID=756892 RepID=UPI00094897E3